MSESEQIGRYFAGGWLAFFICFKFLSLLFLYGYVELINFSIFLFHFMNLVNLIEGSRFYFFMKIFVSFIYLI